MKREPPVRLRILMLEDNPADAELVLAELQHAGIDAETTRVITREDFEARLDPCPDAILSDYQLPLWNGLDALQLVRGRGLDVPFVLVSGTIGEDVAVEAMRKGADDYLLKDRLSRLGGALGQALERKRLRQEALHAAEALREREAGLHQAQQVARLAHVVTRPDGSFERWSESLPVLIGTDATEMPKSTREWLALLHPDDRVVFRDRSILAGKKPARVDIEYRLRRADGAWIHIRQLMEPLEQQPGAAGTTHWFNTIQDVTEQKRAEEKQREMTHLLDKIVENIPTAVQLKSVADGFRVVMWNKAAEAMYGVPRAEAIGRNVYDLWPKPEADRYQASDIDLMASGQMQDFPNRPAQTKDRGEIRVHMRKVALLDAGGQATHLLVIADDITKELADQARLQESEERFRSLSMLSSDWFWEQDEEHRFVKFSGGEGVKGWGPDQRKAIGLHRWDLGGVVPISCSWDEHKELLDAHKPFRGFEYKRVLGDGRLQYVEASGEPIFDANARFTGYRGVATEITPRKEAENKINRLNRVYAVLSSINSLIVRVRNRDELFRESCRIAVEQGEFGMAWIGVLDPATLDVKPVAWSGMDDIAGSMIASAREDMPAGRGLVGRAIRARAPAITNDINADPGAGGPRRAEALRKGFNSIISLPLTVDDEVRATLTLFARERNFFSGDEMKLLTELAGDISFALDHIEKAEKIEYLAYCDALTGLANRAVTADRLNQLVHAARKSGGRLAVAKLDIERLRSVNESLGRQAGDSLLRQVAARLLGVKGAMEIGRASADHFVAFLNPVKGRRDASRKAEQVIKACFEAPFHAGDVELQLAVKAGIALFPGDGDDAETLLKHAEAALRKGKQSGERLTLYTPDLTEQTSATLTLENKLRLALKNGEFVLHYQPKVDLQSRRIQGVEALIRWQSPELGLVPPLKFIPLMEETGMILDAGAWALSRAVADHARWLEQGLPAPRIAVNVSAIQLRRQEFVATMAQALKGGATPPGIDLEITESLLMEDVEASIGKLKQVRELGLGIAIDDFGTGYSSLAYLAKLPLTMLKIDRAFIVAMANDPDSATLVQMMISLAHALKLKVVAEGVETEDQARILRLLRCDQMQGYLVSKALPFDEMTALLASGERANA